MEWNGGNESRSDVKITIHNRLNNFCDCSNLLEVIILGNQVLMGWN